MRKWFRMLGIAMLCIGALFAATLNAAASCTSEQQEQHIWDRYYKDLDTTEDVLNDKALGYVNKAYIYVDTCDADEVACEWERQVPFPVVKKDRPNDKKYYYVYKIRYWHTGETAKKIWKYGIGRYGSTRMKVSTDKCLRSVAPGHCDGKKVIKKIKGWTNARSIEASLVMTYTVTHGKCPPGQRTSCA